VGPQTGGVGLTSVVMGHDVARERYFQVVGEVSSVFGLTRACDGL